MMTLRTIVSISLAICAFAVPVDAQLQLDVENDRVVVRDVAQGDSVAMIGVVQEFPGDTMYVSAPFLVVEDDDRDGEVSLAVSGSPALSPTRARSRHSGFAVVELSSGRNVLGFSAGTRRNVGSDARVVLTDDRDPKPSAVTIRAGSASVMFARPGAGAWHKIIRDGSDSDADGRGNGIITISPASFARITDVSSSPTAFQDGDLVVAIDMYTRKVHLANIGDLAAKARGEKD